MIRIDQSIYPINSPEALKALYAQIKDGRESMFNTNFIITVFSPSYESLLSGLSKVGAILSANNIMNRVPDGRILETIQCTQFLPTMMRRSQSGCLLPGSQGSLP